MVHSLPLGLYESVVTNRLQSQLAGSSLIPDFESIAKSNEPHVFARHVATVVERHLAALPESERLAAANALLDQLNDGHDLAVVRADLLTSLRANGADVPTRPATPLSEVALLTNTRDEPNMASEISRELRTSDRVDLLCAFIRFAGISVIKRELQALRDRGVSLRVITTTYRGATQRRAIDELVNTYGAEVRIRYETASTRLHAKAWMFRRDSGFDTGYVGSSNLSRSAMVDGLEWNVRISSVATPSLIRKFEATFDTYWDEPAFKTYNPSTDGALLDRALAEAGGSGSGRETITVSGLDVAPYPHQERILEALDVARTMYDRHRNLVVAATGTGKTVVAALDYRRLCRLANRPLTLLFVAHRKEILEQSLRKYREVLGDGNFGELYVDGHFPTDGRHVFASIQSLNRGASELDPAQFDVVVVDEFHHAAATTYELLLNRINPVELLGLTATPERSDGGDILRWFGGRSTYELRLWDALEQDLLCPFHFFGIADNTDLRGLTWARGDYKRDDLERVFTGNDARTRLILNAVRDYVDDPRRMRALGFCVSIAHAEYMADTFNRQGIAAVALSATSSGADRSQALLDLRSGKVQCLFAVDLFNEGLDIPDVDTLLMLRPTQSATVFLQQLGRGLRRSRTKAVLTVLDFIGHQRAEFNFAPKLSALTGSRGKNLIDDIEHGFPFFPGASRLVLDRQSQEVILDSIRRALPSNKRSALVASVAAIGTTNLSDYLAQTGSRLDIIYTRDTARAWTPILREAQLISLPSGPDEDTLVKRVRALAVVDDPERAQAYRLLASIDGPTYSDFTPREQSYARMLVFALWPNLNGFTTYDDALAYLRQHVAICAEIQQLLDVTTASLRHVPRQPEGRDDLALFTHAHYRREEVLAAIGFANLERKAYGHAGGFAQGDNDTIALFVRLDKDERHFSPTTMYRDYPISRDLFHWESPNNTALDSTMGRRYVEQRENGATILLFVRDQANEARGADPFIFLGPVDYVSHQGERPIAITWKLRRPMPVDVFETGSVVAL